MNRSAFLASILPGFKAISVTMGYRSGLLSSGPSVVAKEPCTKVAIEEEGVRECVWSSVCPCVVVLVGGCFAALFQAQLIFY